MFCFSFELFFFVCCCFVFLGCIGSILLLFVYVCCEHVLSRCVLLPELRPHFSLASESDPADQEDIDDDEPCRNSAHQSRAPVVAAHDDTVATSGVSTLSSTVSHESHNAQRSVSMELGRMKLETNRWGG